MVRRRRTIRGLARTTPLFHRRPSRALARPSRPEVGAPWDRRLLVGPKPRSRSRVSHTRGPPAGSTRGHTRGQVAHCTPRWSSLGGYSVGSEPPQVMQSNTLRHAGRQGFGTHPASSPIRCSRVAASKMPSSQTSNCAIGAASIRRSALRAAARRRFRAALPGQQSQRPGRTSAGRSI